MAEVNLLGVLYSIPQRERERERERLAVKEKAIA